MEKKYKNFVFTWNNYPEDWAAKLQELIESAQYIIIGDEKGKERNTPHLQGYVIMNTRKTVKQIKKYDKRIHWENRLGSHLQAKDYCKKEGSVLVEQGVEPRQGQRTDLNEIRSLAKHKGMRAVVKVGTFQQIRVAEKYLEYHEQQRNWLPYVCYIYGATGTGKSLFARELAGIKAYTKNDSTKWWYGYDRHESVIIDDFRDSWWPLTDMLSLLDAYPRIVELKGTQRQFLAHNIIITSNIHPMNLYRNVEHEAHSKLMRRINRFLEIEKIGFIREVSF